MFRFFVDYSPYFGSTRWWSGCIVLLGWKGCLLPIVGDCVELAGVHSANRFGRAHCVTVAGEARRYWARECAIRLDQH